MIAGGGLLLQRSDQLNALAEYAMNQPIVSEAPPPDYAIRVVDEHGQPVPAFQVMLLTARRGSTPVGDRQARSSHGQRFPNL